MMTMMMMRMTTTTTTTNNNRNGEGAKTMVLERIAFRKNESSDTNGRRRRGATAFASSDDIGIFEEMSSTRTRKYYLVGGKGGVGKTSLSASPVTASAICNRRPEPTTLKSDLWPTTACRQRRTNRFCLALTSNRRGPASGSASPRCGCAKFADSTASLPASWPASLRRSFSGAFSAPALGRLCVRRPAAATRNFSSPARSRWWSCSPRSFRASRSLKTVVRASCCPSWRRQYRAPLSY